MHHHTPGERVYLVYAPKNPGYANRGLRGVVVCQGRGPGPRNVLVRLDDGRQIIVPAGNVRQAKEVHTP